MKDKINLNLITNTEQKNKIIYHREYLLKNKKREQERHRQYYWKNREKILEKRKNKKYNNNKFFQRNPWLRNYYSARTRCTNKKHGNYHRYGGRGIEFLLTRSEVEHLWFRDRAFLMDTPTIDRIDSNGNYEINNCRFIEMIDNNKKRWEENVS